uniref:protein DEHYDRATION-INDUCED 19 homolog 6-like n=1 Tax=Erigeron canadensis TaxID=72917 RepID=UPI001CB9D57A|nr:protein DEHYDRATION-INDUCED 19 homolog 6-like [Erigeron canadensis]
MWSLIINDDDDEYYTDHNEEEQVEEEECYIDREEEEECSSMEENNQEIGCPYCSDDGFDASGLCFHLEHQHQQQIQSGVCPLCITNLGKDKITQNERVLKGLCKKELYDDESYSIISQLRKTLQEHSLSHKESTSSALSSTSAATGPLILSFIYNPPQSHEPTVDSSAEPTSSPKTLQEDVTLERSGIIISSDSFSRNDHEEITPKSDFIQTILLSTIFADNL